MQEVVKVRKVYYGVMGSTVFTQDKKDYFIPIQSKDIKAKVRKYHKRPLLLTYHTLKETNFKVIDEVEKVKGGIKR